MTVEFEHEIPGRRLTGIADPVELSRPVKDHAGRPEPLAQGLDLTCKNDDGHVIIINVWVIPLSSCESGNVAVKLPQVVRRPLEYDL